MDPLDVYVLRIPAPRLLESAFAHVMACPDVASCMIEPDNHQIRFVAPLAQAQALIERIYLDGGLQWSSRHALNSDPRGA